MSHRHALLCSALLALVVCGIAYGARSYADRAGDVTGGPGPDIVGIHLSNTPTAIAFRIRFASAPPLNANGQSLDVLLISIDVPPLGPAPAAPGGEWRGANYALGTHGRSTTGQLVRLGNAIKPESRLVGTFRIVTSGSTIGFSVPRRLLGNPRWFAFTVAAAREDKGGVDVAPARGTFRYVLT